MTNSKRVHAIRSYIVACCADGKINTEEYSYLKKQSQRFKIKEDELKVALHEMLLSMGKDKCVQRDYKSCVIFTKEALKFQPQSEETVTILSNAIGSLNENDLLELARTTINGLEIYKNLLFEKIKNKGSDYHSYASSQDQPDSKSKEKAIQFLSVAHDIKPEDQDVKSRLDELLGRSGFVILDEEEDIPDFPDTFRDIELYGKGGMSSIYTATYYDPDSRWHERKVIIKLLSNKSKQETIQKLFFKEYNILRDIDNSNILKIIRRGKSGELEYYISEFIQGKNLDELVDEGRGLSKKFGKRNRINDILHGILKGLQGIHEHGIIHRDIKPANIMVTNSANKVKIIDFGLAKTDVYQDKLKEAGTRPYNAPELLTRAFSADNRADIYSFGIVMLELISGRNNREFYQVLPERLFNLKRIIKKCTEEALEARYNYVSEVLDEFTRQDVLDELEWISTNFIDGEVALGRMQEAKSEKPVPPKQKNAAVEQKKILKPILLTLLFAMVGVAIGYFGYSLLFGDKGELVELGSEAGNKKAIQIGNEQGWSYSSTADWLDVVQDEALGMMTLVSLTENTTAKSRTGKVIVTFTDGDQKTFHVNQMGLVPRLKVEPEEILFGAASGDKLDVSITSNNPWQVTYAVPWLRIENNQGTGDGLIHVEITEANPLPEIRTAELSIIGVGNDRKVTILVKQMGSFNLDLEPGEVNLLPAAGTKMQVNMVTNFNWSISNIPEWLEITPMKGGAGNHTIQLRCNKNDVPTQTVRMKIIPENQDVEAGILTINTGEQDVWSGEELYAYVESIRGAEGKLDLIEFYKYVDKNCEVIVMRNGKKLRSSMPVSDFLDKIKLGASNFKVVKETIKYNSAGKISEFCQQE